MVYGKGFGKIILFGDHFAVYGFPGIVSGIDKYVQVDIEKISENDVIFDNKPFNEIVHKSKQKNHVLVQLFNAMFSNYELKNIKLTISGNVIPKAGMGYSAALSVAMAKAVNELLSLNLTLDKINRLAYEGEKVSHGTPSGIDNSCATYGGLLMFQKTKDSLSIAPMKSPNHLYFVIGDTRKKSSTKEVVDEVRTRKEANPEKYAKIFSEYADIVKRAEQAILNGDEKKIGALMNENQQLLRDIDVSSPEIEEIIKIGLDNDALGAKLTGSGKGGLVIILTPDKEIQEVVAKKIERKGFGSIKVTINED